MVIDLDKARKLPREKRLDFYVQIRKLLGFGPRMVGGVNMKTFFSPIGGRKMYEKKMKWINGPYQKKEIDRYLLKKKGIKDPKEREKILRKMLPGVKSQAKASLRTVYRGKLDAKLERRGDAWQVAGVAITWGLILRIAIEAGLIGAYAYVENKARKPLNAKDKQQITQQVLAELRNQQAKGKLKGIKIKK